MSASHRKMSTKAERRRRGRSLRKRGWYYATDLSTKIVGVSDGKTTVRWAVRVERIIPTKKPRRAKNARPNRWFWGSF